MTKYLVFCLIFIFLTGCDEEPVPKQWGYHRIEFPERIYSEFARADCPFTFEYPDYGKFVFDDKEPCWMDIYYKPFHCNWHFTYRDLKGLSENRSKEFEEYRRLIYKHTVKATQIQETAIQTEQVKGVFFEIYGNVPTSAQLFMTDHENKHVVEVSFYFYTSLKNDSLAPVISYMKEDLLHLAETFKWK